MFLQEIVPLRTEQESRMCLPSVQAQPRCEYAKLAAQQKQGKEGRPILGGRGRRGPTEDPGTLLYFVLFVSTEVRKVSQEL